MARSHTCMIDTRTIVYRIVSQMQTRHSNRQTTARDIRYIASNQGVDLWIYVRFRHDSSAAAQLWAIHTCLGFAPCASLAAINKRRSRLVARLSRKVLSTATCPHAAARWAGVAPSLSRASQPAGSQACSCAAQSGAPCRQAQWSGVRPELCNPKAHEGESWRRGARLTRHKCVKGCSVGCTYVSATACSAGIRMRIHKQPDDLGLVSRASPMRSRGPVTSISHQKCCGQQDSKPSNPA